GDPRGRPVAARPRIRKVTRVAHRRASRGTHDAAGRPGRCRRHACMSPGAVDLVIRGGRLVSSTGIMSAGIAIEGGVIVAISRDDALPDSRETIDATGKYVLPGVIDPHVHFRSPGYEYKEDSPS